MTAPAGGGPGGRAGRGGRGARARRGPVAMLAHTYYEEDARVRREAESLVRHGIPVEVFALRRDGTPAEEVLHGVTVRRLGVQRHQGAGLGTYLREYVSFLVRAGLAAARADRRARYRLVQAHSLPDFLVFAALPLRLRGVPVVLDLHEAMPEFFRERFGARLGRAGLRARLAHRLLVVQELASIRFADAVLTVNDALRDRLVALGVPAERVTVLLNSPALDRFDPALHHDRPFMADGTLRLVYAGALTPTYEVDVAVRAVAALRDRRPELPVVLEVYGRGDAEPGLRDLAAELGVAERVRFHGRIPLEEVPAAIAAADVGVAPTRRTPFTDFSLSTKLFEYGAMRRPAVATALPLVATVFGDAVAGYAAGDPGAFADAVLALADDPAARDRRVEAARARVLELAWDRQAERYLALVERLAGR